MNNDFNIYVYSNDANFCSSLAIECNNYGFELTFFEPKNMESGDILNSQQMISKLRQKWKILSVMIAFWIIN